MGIQEEMMKDFYALTNAFKQNASTWGNFSNIMDYL